MTPRFWDVTDLKQPVNQWLCIALIGLACFWVVLFYATHKAEAIGKNFSFGDLVFNPAE